MDKHEVITALGEHGHIIVKVQEYHDIVLALPEMVGSLIV